MLRFSIRKIVVCVGSFTTSTSNSFLKLRNSLKMGWFDAPELKPNEAYRGYEQPTWKLMPNQPEVPFILWLNKMLACGIGNDWGNNFGRGRGIAPAPARAGVYIGTMLYIVSKNT